VEDGLVAGLLERAQPASSHSGSGRADRQELRAGRRSPTHRVEGPSRRVWTCAGVPGRRIRPQRR
jgi:hypothetical protein